MISVEVLSNAVSAKLKKQHGLAGSSPCSALLRCSSGVTYLIRLNSESHLCDTCPNMALSSRLSGGMQHHHVPVRMRHAKPVATEVMGIPARSREWAMPAAHRFWL